MLLIYTMRVWVGLFAFFFFFFFLNHLYPLVLYVFAVDIVDNEIVDTVHNEIAAGFSAILLMTE